MFCAVSSGSLSLTDHPTVITIRESEALDTDPVWKFVVRDEDDDPFTTCALSGTDAAQFTATVDPILGCLVTFNGDKDFDAGDEKFKFNLA